MSTHSGVVVLFGLSITQAIFVLVMWLVAMIAVSTQIVSVKLQVFIVLAIMTHMAIMAIVSVIKIVIITGIVQVSGVFIVVSHLVTTFASTQNIFAGNT